SLKPSGMASAESTAQNARPGGRGRPNIVLFVPDELRAGRFLRSVPPFRHPLAPASRTPPAPPLPRGAAGVERAHAADRCRISQSAGGVLRAGELFRLAPRRAGRSPGPDRTLARYGPGGVLGSRRLRGGLRPVREVALGPGGLPDPRAPHRPHSRWRTGARVTGAGRALRCHADLSRSRRHEGDAYSFRAQPHATAPRLGGRSTARRLHGRRLQHLRAPGFRANHRGALRPEDTAAERAARNRSEEHTSELQSPYDLVCPSHFAVSLHVALPIFDLAGTKATHTHFARSLMPQLHGSAGDPQRAAFTEGGYNTYEPQAFEPIIEGLYGPKTRLQNEQPE